MVLGGATGPLAGAWPSATRGATTTAPATTPTVLMSPRRDMFLSSDWQASRAIIDPPRTLEASCMCSRRLGGERPTRDRTKRLAWPSTAGCRTQGRDRAWPPIDWARGVRARVLQAVEAELALEPGHRMIAGRRRRPQRGQLLARRITHQARRADRLGQTLHAKDEVHVGAEESIGARGHVATGERRPEMEHHPKGQRRGRLEPLELAQRPGHPLGRRR